MAEPKGGGVNNELGTTGAPELAYTPDVSLIVL